MNKKISLNPVVPLMRYPFIFLEMIIASFVIALLGLASPIFSMQVLNRYISHGFDGTLITLTIGVSIALIFLTLIRITRNQILSEISLNIREDMNSTFLNSILNTSLIKYNIKGNEEWQKNMYHLLHLEKIYLPSSIATYLDAPFCFIYLGFIFIINKLLGWVTIGVITLYIGGIELINIYYIRKNSAVNLLQQKLRSNILSLFPFIECLKQDITKSFVIANFQRLFKKTQKTLRGLLFYGELSNSHQRAVGMLLNVLIYAFGGVETVEGRLTIGGLIGASILSSRAFGGIASFFLLKRSLKESREYAREFYNFLEEVQEKKAGEIVIPSPKFKGEIAINDLAFSYPEAINPIFEKINMHLSPGTSMGIVGFNGSGKSTFIKLLCKLLYPSRGYIMVDNQNLIHINTSWWREKIIYLPQEPSFLPIPLRDNILLGRKIQEVELEEILMQCDLIDFIRFSPQGLETPLHNGALNLSMGIRKRIALARALINKGNIVIMDEPTAHLDNQGKRKLYHLLNTLKREGKTIIIATDDPYIIRGSEFILDLSPKPTPLFGKNKSIQGRKQ